MPLPASGMGNIHIYPYTYNYSEVALMYIGNYTLLNHYNVSCPTLPQLVEIPTSPTLPDGGEGGLLWLLHVRV